MGQSNRCVGPQDPLGTRATQAHVGAGAAGYIHTCSRLGSPWGWQGPGSRICRGAGVSMSKWEGDPRLCSPAACKPLL